MTEAATDYGAISVLLVDDNRHMLSLMRHMLRAIGVRHMHESLDAAEAFETCKSSTIDLIITDLKMDPLDGIEFVKLLRTAEDSPNKYVPIIMLTGVTERRVVEQARDAGVTEFLAKPIGPRDLMHRIWRIVDQPRPFVRAPGYFGPDRRRRAPPRPGRRPRRSAAPAPG